MAVGKARPKKERQTLEQNPISLRLVIALGTWILAAYGELEKGRD